MGWMLFPAFYLFSITHLLSPPPTSIPYDIIVLKDVARRILHTVNPKMREKCFCGNISLYQFNMGYIFCRRAKGLQWLNKIFPENFASLHLPRNTQTFRTLGGLTGQAAPPNTRNSMVRRLPRERFTLTSPRRTRLLFPCFVLFAMRENNRLCTGTGTFMLARCNFPSVTWVELKR